MKKKEKKQIYRSIMEFERSYYPKFFKQKILAKQAGARARGANLAKESLEKIKERLEV